MPTHIIVNGLGLTYKGTIGISTATIPDVCKTPSPAGTVPIPYPNIADQSSLREGTITVSGMGEMCAVKGAQFGRSMGDELGTAGGVKCGKNMKETDYLTYSFDVKMDGKNACRHTDKTFHNNKNTVNCAGVIDPLAGGDNPLKIKCADAPASSSTKFTDCQKKEICAKCKRINEMAKDPNTNLSRTTGDKAAHKKRRQAGNSAAAKMKRQQRKRLDSGDYREPVIPYQVDDPDCQKELQEQAEKNDYTGFSADHVHEIQIGGHTTAIENLKWMTSRANGWIGTTLKQLNVDDPDNHTGVKPDCC